MPASKSESSPTILCKTSIIQESRRESESIPWLSRGTRSIDLHKNHISKLAMMYTLLLDVLSVAVIDTGISRSFHSHFLHPITYIDCTDDTELYTEGGTHAEKVLNQIHRPVVITLYKVQNSLG